MELSQLRTFRVVAETLNFTRAAERLHLTQSAVSHQIKALENELGEPLFIRTKRGVKVSQVGKAALEHAGTDSRRG
jgi:LysR family cyn operon transcriptional activator